MLWKGFQRPKRLEVDRESLTDHYGRFYAQPFERGFATTVGNALRRVLLSSIEGAAITAIRVEGVLHEGIDIALDDPPGRVRAQEFQTRGVLSAEMLRRLDAVIDYARGALPRLSLTDLSKERKDEDGTITCGWALLHALEHAYMQLGHAQVTCQMWRQREK